MRPSRDRVEDLSGGKRGCSSNGSVVTGAEQKSLKTTSPDIRIHNVSCAKSPEFEKSRAVETEEHSERYFRHYQRPSHRSFAPNLIQIFILAGSSRCRLPGKQLTYLFSKILHILAQHQKGLLIRCARTGEISPPVLPIQRRDIQPFGPKIFGLQDTLCGFQHVHYSFLL